MKTYVIAPALVALYLILQSTGFVQAGTAEGLDTLKEGAAKPAAVAANFQHHLFKTGKRNVYRLALANPEASPAAMRVYDEQGHLMHRCEIKTDTLLCELDVTPLQPGAYTLRITAGRRVAEEKFTVQ